MANNLFVFKKRCVIGILLVVLLFALYVYGGKSIVSADIISTPTSVDIYSIYDEKLNLLFQREEVEIGDNYLASDYKFYEITYVDTNNKYAIAKFIEQKNPPQVSKSHLPKKIKVTDKKICMYMTHNDESYVSGDGVDSVYGNGGIKDVAIALKSALENRFVDVYLDDTLHIPHDTSAYSRSKVTAQNLQKKHSPDAIFDIHRDGASRSYYVTKVNGVERARVRMVIGKANPNMQLNEEFAMYLMAVGNELYPWLFTDIYYAKGHYNQALDSKAILFEMGSHLVEKNLVIKSMEELSDVITTALYDTTVSDESGEIIIDGTEDESNKVVNDILDEKEAELNSSGLMAVAVVVLVATSISMAVFFAFARMSGAKRVSKKR